MVSECWLSIWISIGIKYDKDLLFLNDKQWLFLAMVKRKRTALENLKKARTKLAAKKLADAKSIDDISISPLHTHIIKFEKNIFDWYLKVGLALFCRACPCMPVCARARARAREYSNVIPKPNPKPNPNPKP